MEAIQRHDLSDICPTLIYEVHLTEGEPHRSDRSLIISFVGQYRAGELGNSDATYMQGVIDLASEMWWHRSLVIDLTRVAYECGDGIEYSLEPPRRKPVAIVVGPECQRGLARLWFGEETSLRASQKEGVFDDLPSALAYLRRA